ncbi:MAG: helix-turn-helix domain-containing protein [Cyanobacteria bacterium P01_A01_bin.105]
MVRKYDWKTGCDVEATLSVIGGRWKPILMCHLLGGRKRFGELRRLTPNATERMITLQLRELEADGVISRQVYAEVPPRVEYELTEFGRSLEAILTLMQDWGREFKARRLAEAPETEAPETEAPGGQMLEVQALGSKPSETRV